MKIRSNHILCCQFFTRDRDMPPRGVESRIAYSFYRTAIKAILTTLPFLLLGSCWVRRYIPGKLRAVLQCSSVCF